MCKSKEQNFVLAIFFQQESNKWEGKEASFQNKMQIYLKILLSHSLGINQYRAFSISNSFHTTLSCIHAYIMQNVKLICTLHLYVHIYIRNKYLVFFSKVLKFVRYIFSDYFHFYQKYVLH